MLERSALVISPTPPLPRDYGNRNRVFQTINFLKSLGYKISLLLYPFDDDWAREIPDYYKELNDTCDYFSVVPNSRALHQDARAYHHTIDEWWDENIAQKVKWLLARKKFDVMFVNYTFFSAAFTFAPPDMVKILDTHDLFSGRREMFEEHGVPAEFFYTSKEQERIAFERADAIIAIKQSEADFISSVCDKKVFSIPYWDGQGEKKGGRVAPARFDHENPLVVGFIGALNSVNVVNMARFLELFERYVRLYDLPIKVVIAGNVCKKLGDYFFVEKLGRVPKLEDFYCKIDAVIAPLEFSTGIKIKVGEALAWNIPVLATKNAFDGFHCYHKTQSERTVADLCETLANLATNEQPFDELAIATRRAARAAVRAQDRGFSALQEWIKTTAKRIVIVTGRPFWFREAFVDEQIAQTVEYLSHILPTIVITTCPDVVRKEDVFANVVYVKAKPDEVREIVGEIASFSEVVALLQCECAAREPKVGENVDIKLLWTLKSTFASVSRGRGLSRFHFAVEGSEPLAVSPLRYLPLRATKDLQPARVAIFAPQDISAWQALVADLVMANCKQLGITAVVLRVPEYHVYDRQFFIDAVMEPAQRSILIGADGWESFLLQMAHYRGGECMIVGKDYLTPQVVDSEGKPSLQDSIVSFVRGDTAAGVSADANSGWDEVWSIIASAARSDAAQLSR